MNGIVYSINISSVKRGGKTKISQAEFNLDTGLKEDFHANKKNRNISLISLESFENKRACPRRNNIKEYSFKAGDFNENITTKGINLSSLKVGDNLILNNEVVLEITSKGRECINFCNLVKNGEKCLVPSESVFAIVKKSGVVKIGSDIVVNA